MAATEGSVYQILRTQHIAGSPPNTDPQRPTETFEAYKARMAVAALPPDIGEDEADEDYEARLLTYVPSLPVENISASYAIYAGSEMGPQISSSWADRAGLALLSLSGGFASQSNTASLARTASYVVMAQSASWVAGATTISTSYADSALSVNGPTVRVTNTNTIGVQSETTTATSVYGLSTLNNGVLGAQNGILAGNLNRGAVAAYRDVTPANDFDSVMAVLEVTDAKVTGSAPLIQAFVVSEEKFKVDKNGILYSSGSAGLSTNLVIGTTTLFFKGGLFISSSVGE